MSSFFSCPGLHNKFTNFYRLSNFDSRICLCKIARPCQVLRVSNFVTAASVAAVKFYYTWHLQLQVPAESGCGENLKFFKIYDIIKGGPFGPAQQIQLVSNFAIRANLWYNIYVR